MNNLASQPVDESERKRADRASENKPHERPLPSEANYGVEVKTGEVGDEVLAERVGVEALAGDTGGEVIAEEARLDPAEALTAEALSHDQRSAVGGRMPTWQEIIWREWRHTGDEEYAEHLFNLVADEPVGREATISSTVLGMFYGGMVGLLLGLITSLGESPVWGWPGLLGLGAVLGGVGGLLARLFVERQLSWRVWMARLTFNMAPSELGLVGIGLAFVLFGGLTGWLLGWSTGLGHLVGIIALGILLAVGLGTRVVGWLVGLGREPDPISLHRYRSLWFWWRQRPRGLEVEAALRQAREIFPDTQAVWTEVLQNLERRKKQPGPLEKLVTHLQSLNWIERFTAAHLLAASGGEAVSHLQPIATKKTSPLRGTAIRLLRGIEHETTAHLAERAANLLCPHCLARCGSHSVAVSEETKITYYGCRMCGQSLEFLEGEVVAVLDTDVTTEPISQSGMVRINWLARRTAFDFDSVEIIQATDEEVERFAVQVGNDTDPFRQPHYRQKRCVIGPACDLSENTLRILRRTFGEVELMS